VNSVEAECSHRHNFAYNQDLWNPRFRKPRNLGRPASSEPAGLQPGESVAAAGSAPTDRELVADESAATSGENQRATGETCTFTTGYWRKASEPAAVRGDAGPDRTVTGADGIERVCGRVYIRVGLTRGWPRRSVAVPWPSMCVRLGARLQDS
jgi:hypothetical protein